LRRYRSSHSTASASTCRAQLFAEAHSDADVREALAYAAAQAVPLLVIGGGSNLLLTRDIPALVLRMATQGIRVLQDDGQHVVVEAEAGEAWHPFVLWTWNMASAASKTSA